MAQHRRDFTKGPEFVDAGMNLVDIMGTLRLRQRNNNGQWTPYGRYGVGNALIDIWSPKAPIQLTGFVAEADVHGSDQLLFRLSPDGGATERWWNGVAWAVPTDPVLHWNTEDVIDAHIATFAMETGIAQIARFVSFDGSTTPILIGTSIYFEVQYEPTVDLIDSIARKIAAGLEVQGVFQTQVPSVGQSVSGQLTVDEPIWMLADPIQVFNDTTDPNRRTNLYVSRVGNILTLSAPQTGFLTVLYTGKLDLTKIHVATDADVEKAELPAIVLQTPTSMRKRYENTFDDYEELLRGLGVIRKRKSATFEEVRVHIQCNAAWDLHGRKLRDAMRSFIEEQLETVRSIALDELLVRTWVGPFAATHDMPEQTASFDVPAVFEALNWPSHYIDVPIVGSVDLQMWLGEP